MKNSVFIFLCLLCMLSVSAVAQTPQDRSQIVKDFISGEEIRLYEAYRIPGKHGWYIKKHSPQACRMYKNWYDDYQEKYQTLQQRLLERYLKESDQVKKHKHASRFVPKCNPWGCKAPVLSEFGLVEVRDWDGKRVYRHYECAEMERLRVKDAQMLYEMGITHDFCKDVFESMDKEKQGEEEKAADIVIRERDAVPAPQPSLVAASPAKPAQEMQASFKDTQKKLERFSYEHRSELQKIRRIFAANGREDVALLSPKLREIYEQFQQHWTGLQLAQQ